MRIIGYTFEADIHCTACAAERFGWSALDKEETEDAEGNPVRPVYSTDECPPDGEYCGDCGGQISEPYGED